MWKGTAGERYLIREVYKRFSLCSLFPFPEKGIWVPCFVPKLLFCLGGSLGKVLILDKLQRRGWQLPNRCFLCGCAEEMIHHILLHCNVVSSLWEIIFTLVNVHWVFPSTVKETIGAFVGRGRGFGNP